MNKTQALALIKQVVEAYRGSLQEHQALQQAMDVIEDKDKTKKEKS